MSLSPTQSQGVSGRGQSQGQLLLQVTNPSSHEELADSRLPRTENAGVQETQTFGGLHSPADATVFAGSDPLYTSLLNGSILDRIQYLDPSVRHLIASLQQHNAALTELLAAH